MMRYEQAPANTYACGIVGSQSPFIDFLPSMPSESLIFAKTMFMKLLFPISEAPAIACFFILFMPFTSRGQSDTAMEKKNLSTLEVRAPSRPTLHDYKASATRATDLVSTRLDVRPDFRKHCLYGKEWLKFTPHFYPTDSLVLDAKGMDVHTVALIRGNSIVALKYRYDDMKLYIKLGHTYQHGQQYRLFIDYTAKPDKYAAQNRGGSSAITSDKGLYFINPDGKNPYMPTEVWTQGETEANSVWFPTIDEPNQKSLEELSITVPKELTTLSNGQLISQHSNRDGTRTDTWKMKHPHAPYLFMLAAGPFIVVKDHWKDIPVNYYVEKKSLLTD